MTIIRPTGIPLPGRFVGGFADSLYPIGFFRSFVGASLFPKLRRFVEQRIYGQPASQPQEGQLKPASLRDPALGMDLPSTVEDEMEGVNRNERHPPLALWFELQSWVWSGSAHLVIRLTLNSFSLLC